jgi:hypothetical protein
MVGLWWSANFKQGAMWGPPSLRLGPPGACRDKGRPSRTMDVRSQGSVYEATQSVLPTKLK